MHLLRTLHIKKAWAEYPAVSPSIIKAGILMLCFNFALEKKRRGEERRESHAEHSSLAKLHVPPLQEDGDNFLWQIIFFLETWKGFWNIHMDFVLQTIPLQTEWFTVGCITVFQCCIHCHCVIEKRAASNYNRRHICSQCLLWLMCEGCGRSSNEVQMAWIETLLIDWAWQTITSAMDISVLNPGCHRSGRNERWIN